MPRQKRPNFAQRKDKRYRCKYRGKQFYGRSPEEAAAKREEYKRQEAAGEFIRANPTVAQYAEQWLPRRYVGAAYQTKKEAEALMKKLTDAIGDDYIRNILPSDIKAIYADHFAGLSGSYIRSASQLYCAMFDAAVDDGICKKNPARQKSAKPHKGTQAESRAITAQEREWIEKLCIDHRAHATVMAMLYAGIRPQECKAMNIDRDIDMEAGIIRVNQSVHLSSSNQYESSAKLKTDFSRREIPLFPPLKKALAGQHGMLIKSAKGKAVTVQAWRSAWNSYIHDLETAINGCEERWYGKKKEHKGKKLPPFIKVTFTPYDLRHSFCTMCRNATPPVEINTVIHWMGHKDAKMILRIYDEYSIERGKKEAERITKTLFSGSDRGSNTEPPSKSPDIAE